MLIYLQLLETQAELTKFEQIYQKYRGLMFHVARDILHNAQDAEDVVHQAFVSVATHMDDISDAVCTKTQAFVVTIVERKAIDLYRAKQRKPLVPLDEETAGLCFDLPDSGGVAQAFAKLPARYRSFLLLKYDSGYTNPELAKILGLSYEGVHSLDARAKRKLQKLLEEEEITL